MPGTHTDLLGGTEAAGFVTKFCGTAAPAVVGGKGGAPPPQKKMKQSKGEKKSKNQLEDQ